ncbi:MAG: NAD(P)/FAD-dependent oxidoreductase [Paludibacteraceae bacterium]|nr:NAD(P)/FAD-dependent oxidoreductase [Paludibacteraceae bacterium]
MYDVVIIGSGLGGLECGVILSLRGLSVCVLEKERVVGGCLQSYRRGSWDLDTGFHYVGGLGKGQKLHEIFDGLGLMELPWHKMDVNAFDRVVIDGQVYDYAMGFDEFENRMSGYFPHQAHGIREYVDLLRSVAANIGDSEKSLPLFGVSAKQWLEERISDPTLIKVLCGTSLKLELTPQLPLYTFAQINSSFIQSSWRLKGSGQQVADLLKMRIESLGGVVKTNADVVRLEEDSVQVTAAVLSDGTRVEGKVFISDIHPAATMALLDDSKLVKRIQRGRLSRLDNTYGMLTVSIVLKDSGLPYTNRNTYIYKDVSDIWNPAELAQGRALLISERYDGTDHCRQIDLLTPVMWGEVEQWQDSKVMRRGAEYDDWKQRRAQQAISLAQSVIPALGDMVEKTYVSSPLTYRDYTGTAQGSAYGIRKDCNNVMLTLLSPRTSAPNLLLTGQNLNLHGILGTSMTALMTAAAVEVTDAIK